MPSTNSIRISREGVRKFDGEVEEKEADKIMEGRGGSERNRGLEERKRKGRVKEREREKLDRVRKDVIVEGKGEVAGWGGGTKLLE